MFSPAGIGVLQFTRRRDFHVVVDFNDSRHVGDAGLRKLLQVIGRYAPAQRQNAARKVARDIVEFKISGSPQGGLGDFRNLLKQSSERIGTRTNSGLAC